MKNGITFKRKDATHPVFTVIRKFFPLPHLFARTYEFFKKSLIYYRNRPDLMKIEHGKVVNRFADKLACWNER